MKDEPEIVKMLREKENLGILQSKVQSVYEQLDAPEESSENTPDEAVGFGEEDLDEKTRVDDTNHEKILRYLNSSEEKFRMIFENLNDMIIYIDKHGKIIEINKKVEDTFGYKPEEVIGKNFTKLNLFSIKDLSKILKIFKNVVLGDKEIDLMELEVKHKEGYVVPIEVSTKSIKKNGKTEFLLCIVRDITERKKNEEKLRESEERYRDLFENATDLIQAVKSDGSFLYVNRAWKKVLGYNEKEIESLSVFDIIHPDSKEHCMKTFKRIMSGENIEPVEASFLTKEGREIIVEGSINCRFEDGKPVSTRGIFRDITKRKQTEEKIQQQNKFLNTILESLPYPFYVIDANDYSVKMANTAAGFDSLSGKHITCYELTHRRSKPCEDTEHLCPLRVVKKTKKPVIVEHTHYDKDGNPRLFEVHGIPIFDDNGNVVQMIEYSLDITDRKKTEERLRFLSSMVEQSSDGMAIADLDGNLLFVNKAWSQMHGYKSGEKLVGQPLKIFHSQEQLKKDVIPFNQKVKKNGFHRGEVGHIRKDGTPFLTLMTTTLLKDGRGNPYAIADIANDITELKSWEKSISESEERLRTVLEAVKEGIVFSDELGHFEVYNSEMEKLTGYSFEEVNASSDFNMLIYPDPEDHRRALDGLNKLVKLGDVYKTETRIHTKKGKTRDVLVSTTIVQYKDKKMFLSAYRDITERKQDEVEIKHLKEYNENILESNPSPIIVIKGNQIEYVNKSFISAFGKTKNNYISKDLKEVISSKIIPVFEELLQDYDKMKELEIKSKNFSASSFIVKKEEQQQGEVRKGIILQDITKRKQTEDALQESAKRYRELIEGSHDGYIVTDMGDRVTEYNSIFKRITGYTDEELLKKTWKDITPQEWHSVDAKIVKEQILKKGYSDIYEEELIGIDGKIIPVELRKHLLKEKGKPIGMWSFVRDITDRKQTDDELMRKIDALERYKNITVGRELRLIELKKEVNNLCNKLGETPKYKTEDDKSKEK